MSRHEFHEFDYSRGSHDHYDRTQPRVPRGHPDGGQWTRGSYRALSDLAELPAPDLRDDDRDPALYTRLAALRPRGPLPGTQTKPPPKPPNPESLGIFALGGLIIRKMLRDLFGLAETVAEPVVPLKARLHRWDGEKYVQVAETLLDESEVLKYCPELKKIRTLLNDAVKEAGPPGKNKGAYGSRVHALVKEAIKRFNADPENKDKTLGTPEVSFRENGEITGRYEKGTIRPDLHKRRNEKVWCVFDHKVSVAARMDDDYMDEIAIRLSRANPEQIGGELPEHLVIIETKPRHPPELRSPANR